MSNPPYPQRKVYPDPNSSMTKDFLTWHATKRSALPSDKPQADLSVQSAVKPLVLPQTTRPALIVNEPPKRLPIPAVKGIPVVATPARIRPAPASRRWKAYGILKLALEKPLEIDCSSCAEAAELRNDLFDGLVLLDARWAVEMPIFDCTVCVRVVDPVAVITAMSVWAASEERITASVVTVKNPHMNRKLQLARMMSHAMAADPGEVRWAANFVENVLKHTGASGWWPHQGPTQAIAELRRFIPALTRTGWYPSMMKIRHDKDGCRTWFEVTTSTAAERVHRERAAADIIEAAVKKG